MVSEPIPSRVIYVGSIPYDQTEEQILDIFKSVGPVASFRLVFDKDSGKSKGFGFVEYHDTETAASAVRNLNNYQIGSRNLKVDFSHETSITAPTLVSYPEVSLPQLPHGTMPAPGVTAHDSVNKTLMKLTRDQMLDVILDLKTMSQKNPLLACELFRVSPQLSYMVVQSMLMLGIIDNNAILSLVDQNFQQQQQQIPPSLPSQPAAFQNILQGMRPYGSTPPPTQPRLHTPPPATLPAQPKPHTPEPSQPAASQAPEMPSQQIELIRKVMQLTDDQVAQLSEDQRDALLVLREQVRSGKFQI
ncbi:uncharacterized protein SAPINGB_P002109 [Magnusiomyces paraingens]|uniref:RRM domain-containing protein n=1 Tax=Magnusiomyces paraingens TaxID=2606893 RepID=A0A5E8BCT2_9ASCO|nr:uncharacterized protein SAPINGB_P002109 [Saprochaete ingens]VVT49111.1 unnamed protein product [Saprochaete ingens]